MKYLSILIVTAPILAQNNCGESSGNAKALQKITTPSGARTVLSGAALKYAIRQSMQASGKCTLWRKTLDVYDPEIPANYVYGPDKKPAMMMANPGFAAAFDDTLLFGYMLAGDAASNDKAETPAPAAAEPASSKSKNKTPEPLKKGINKAKAQMEISDAISTTPYEGDTGFGQGLKPASPHLNPFAYERHFTRYAFTININLEGCKARPQAVVHALETLLSLQVGGNHSIHASEVSPSLLAWRFHAEPGCGGLYLNADYVAPPDQPVPLEPLHNRARNLGFTFQVAGEGQELTVAEGIKRIIAQLQ